LWKQAKEHPLQDGQKITIWQRPGTYIMTGCVMLVVLGGIHIKHVLDLATKYIFIDAFHDRFA
jgi:hypothetical protein